MIHARLSRPLAALFVALHAAALFAGILAPYEPTRQDRDRPYAPPTAIRFVDGEGRFHVRPFVYGLVPDDEAPNGYRDDRGARFPVRWFVRPAGPGPDGGPRLFGVDRPGVIYLLGTDAFGRDQFSRLVIGARTSVSAGWLAAGLTLAIGLLLGTLAGFYGGWIDRVIMRLAELFLALPWLYVLLAARSALPLHLDPAQAFLLLVLVIGVVGWARPARLVRGVVVGLRARGFVEAARAFGSGDASVLRRHVLPDVAGLLLTQATLLIPRYVLAEVTLSFLGLGVGEPAPTWGNMLAPLQRYHVLETYWWMWSPAFALILLTSLYYALADALQRTAIEPSI